jgi:hypothetical protein
MGWSSGGDRWGRIRSSQTEKGQIGSDGSRSDGPGSDGIGLGGFESDAFGRL